jgi:hypothetical protein
VSIKREGDIEGFVIQDSRVENRQNDTFSRGQGFSISLTKVATEPGTPDEYKATSSDGKFEVTAPTEERAAYDLQQVMLEAGRKGEL